MTNSGINSSVSNKTRWFTPGHPAQLVIGFVIWSIWFIAMYGGLSVGCQLDPPAVKQGVYTWLNGSLFVLTLLVMTLLFFLAWRSSRYWVVQRRAGETDAGFKRFVGYVSTVLYLLAAVATLAGGLPVLVFSPCS